MFAANKRSNRQLLVEKENQTREGTLKASSMIYGATKVVAVKHGTGLLVYLRERVSNVVYRQQQQ
jgi:hypothetical protein